MIRGIDRRAGPLLGVAAIVTTLAAGPRARADAGAEPQSAPAAPLILASGALAQLAPLRPSGELPIEVRQSIGCLVAGTAGTTLALAGGGLGLITNLAASAGAPSVGALTLGLTGVLFGTFCAVGAVMTPLYVHLTAPRPLVRPAPVQRHASPPAAPPRAPAYTAVVATGDDLRSAAFRSGVLTNALALRESPR